MANADAISRLVSEDLEGVFAGAALPPMLFTPTPRAVRRPLPERGRSNMRYAGALVAAVLTGVTVGSLIQRKPAGTAAVLVPIAAPPTPTKATPAVELPGPTTIRELRPLVDAGLLPMAQKSAGITAPPPAPTRRAVAQLRPVVAKAPLATLTAPRPPPQIQPLPVPVPPVRLEPAAVPASVERGCPGGAAIGPDCEDEQLIAAEEDLREAYLAARRAGVPVQVLRYDQARWAETREAAASRSRQALLGAYRAHTSDLFDSADSALSRSPETLGPDEGDR